MLSIQLVHVHVPDHIEIFVHQCGMRLDLIHRIMYVEHRAQTRARDGLHDARGLFERGHHVALAFGQGFHQNGHASLCGMRRRRSEPVDEMPRGLLARSAAGGSPLLG